MHHFHLVFAAFVFCIAVTIDESAVSLGFAGDNAVITLTGIEPTNLSVGKLGLLFCANISNF